MAAFSVRAGPGFAVSMPIAWDELEEVRDGDQWAMLAAVKRQRSLDRDPWDGYWRTRQGIRCNAPGRRHEVVVKA
ncbi:MULTISPECIES: hypothetical protein [unclassified Caballeronia]|uniref:non-homologous end-joining DNA ligase LigD n=1 Tax=unclassified Caballeronia TaxID=2646786 RepID=UPI00285CF484|nr:MULTISPECIES: hypothetical protein [unclassified Caballeronia]MDR5776430.1 hypothetical protein [Caballeronia sp. LZ002]MDR5851788.1 hypothetical protein [Caballeronia sp. LZ003]